MENKKKKPERDVIEFAQMQARIDRPYDIQKMLGKQIVNQASNQSSDQSSDLNQSSKQETD